MAEDLILAAGWWRDGEFAQNADDIPAGAAFWIIIPDGCLKSASETFTFTFPVPSAKVSTAFPPAMTSSAAAHPFTGSRMRLV